MDVILIDPTQIGPLGITLAAAPDAGGGQGQHATTVPIVKPAKWLDARGLCALAHAYLAARGYAAGEPRAEADDLPNFRGCQSYRRGICLGNGWDAQTPCVFTQLADDEGWAAVKTWRQLPDGTGVCSLSQYRTITGREPDNPGD